MGRFKSYEIGDVVRVYPAKAGPDGNEGIHTVVNRSGDDYALARGQVSPEAIATGHYDVWIHARRIKRAHAGVVPACRIKWIGPDGKETPDDNPSVGVVYREAYIEQFHGRAIQYTETERFPICAEHAKHLDDPKMHRWHFTPHTSDSVDSLPRAYVVARREGDGPSDTYATLVEGSHREDLEYLAAHVAHWPPGTRLSWWTTRATSIEAACAAPPAGDCWPYTVEGP